MIVEFYVRGSEQDRILHFIVPATWQGHDIKGYFVAAADPGQTWREVLENGPWPTGVKPLHAPNPGAAYDVGGDDEVAP